MLDPVAFLEVKLMHLRKFSIWSIEQSPDDIVSGHQNKYYLVYVRQYYLE